MIDYIPIFVDRNSFYELRLFFSYKPTRFARYGSLGIYSFIRSVISFVYLHLITTP